MNHKLPVVAIVQAFVISVYRSSQNSAVAPLMSFSLLLNSYFVPGTSEWRLCSLVMLGAQRSTILWALF
ncbi:hypothetical protein DPB93_16200 [Salmonella enterica subsp. salamae]|nr:hypothetical protein [Salmonella enterica subsp. salamae]